MIDAAVNFDQSEIEKFDAMATKWWDEKGPCRPLHELNPLRLDFIQQYVSLADQHVLDVGCGGGILSEGLAIQGAHVTGIDLSQQALTVAQQHAQAHQLNITYKEIAVETLAEQQPAQFDIITCFELLEHVPDPSSIIRACAQLIKPHGHLFFSTINRNFKAYLFAILGAEYFLKLLPKGTHEYQKFIKPNELAAWLRTADIRLEKLCGMGYHPLTRQFYLTNDISVNYLAYCRENLAP
jgi:2-polyprenyl-6-hydroxyphenyl methylase/3-demethylubiquinone-9 3-methyltransferase